jgi:hypothetical protein
VLPAIRVKIERGWAPKAQVRHYDWAGNEVPKVKPHSEKSLST